MDKTTATASGSGQVIELANHWIERTLEAGDGGIRTIALVEKRSGTELAQPDGDEFLFVASWDATTVILKAADFKYVRHETASEADGDRTVVTLRLRSPEPFGFTPFSDEQGQGEAEAGSGERQWGTFEVELIYLAYREHPVIRKWLRLRNLTQKQVTINHLAWEDLRLASGAGRIVHHDFFTRSSAAVTDNMDDSAMAIVWEDARCGLIAATEAPGAMKRMEVFNEPDRLRILYNNIEETLFETILLPGETFASDASFLLAFGETKWQDAVDGEFRDFVEQVLTIGDAALLPSFTLNTWETFFSNVEEEAILANIELAAELGFDSYQIDVGWHVSMGDYDIHPTRFPNGLEPVVEACRKHGIRLGLWMSIPNVHFESPVAKEHPEWFLMNENGGRGFMTGWSNTGTMCLASGFKEWITEQISTVVAKYGVELLKLDLAAGRDPYQPGKDIGCHDPHHNHRSHRSSNLDIYRSMFDIMDELRRRHPSCIIDLTYELYGVLHGTDLAHVQHAHQNWFINQNTQWLDMFRRMVHTRSRVVPAHTLNFGSCSLHHEEAKVFGFWNALSSHGLYYGDLRLLSEEDRAFYRKWISWVKAYRVENDFYRHHKVSDVFLPPDTPTHVDRRYKPFSNHEIARFVAYPKRWDGVARLDDNGEGLVLIFRAHSCDIETETVRLPWMLADEEYELTDVLGERVLGRYNGAALHEGLECRITEAPGVLVLLSRRV